MKKFLSVLCLICLLFSCASVTAMAAGKGKIEGTSCTTERGETVEFSLSLKENPGMWGTKIKIKYDDSALTLKSVSAGKVFDESELTCSEKMSKNPYVVVATGKTAKNKTTTGKLVTLKFAVSKDADYKEYPIEVNIVQSINASGKDIDMSAIDGSITVKKEQATPSEPGDNDEPTKPGDGNEDPSKPGDGNDEPSEPSDGNDDPTKPGNEGGDEPSKDESEGTAGSDENSNEESTGTGDNNTLMPFICIMAAALAVFVATIKRRRS